MPSQSPAVADTLCDAIDRVGSPVCVGLDPVIEQIPDSVRTHHHEPLPAIAEFCRGVIKAVRSAVPAVKFQSACFERYGGRGVSLLEELSTEAAAAGLFVVWDAKRGDIGISSHHYAAAAKRMHAHAVTLSGYLGSAATTPFLEQGLGVFVLVRTSNPEGDRVQLPTLADGRLVCELMADEAASLGAAHVGRRGLSAVGAVVGATKAAQGAALRTRMPNQVFLIPGYGAQGGKPEDIRAMLRPAGSTPGTRGVLVTSSRAIIYAPAGEGQAWNTAVERAARAMAGEIRGVLETTAAPE
jgi:orotidine-5'-phosphate decarboxylase